MLNKVLVRVALSVWMLAAVSFRLRMNVYAPMTSTLRAWGFWPPTDLMQLVQSLIGL